MARELFVRARLGRGSSRFLRWPLRGALVLPPRMVFFPQVSRLCMRNMRLDALSQ